MFRQVYTGAFPTESRHSDGSGDSTANSKERGKDEVDPVKPYHLSTLKVKENVVWLVSGQNLELAGLGGPSASHSARLVCHF